MDLSGKVAIVTGSGRGLGLAYAEALAAAGAAVVVNDVDADAAAAGRRRDHAGRRPGRRRRRSRSAPPRPPTPLVDTAVEKFGRLDVMVTNAGILRDRVLWKMSDEDFDAVIDVHLRGTFTCARAAAVQMRAQGDGRPADPRSPRRPGSAATSARPTTPPPRRASSPWPAPGRWSCARAGITVNAVVPVAATEMTKTIPAFAAVIEESERTGQPLPDWLRKDVGFGTRRGRRRARSSSSPPTPPPEVTGQAIGIGGDRLSLWSHPQEKAVAYARRRLDRRRHRRLLADRRRRRARDLRRSRCPEAHPEGGLRCQLAIDVDSLVAIDMHTHAEVSADGHGSLSPELFGGLGGVLQGARRPAAHHRPRSPPTTASARWPRWSSPSTPSTPPATRRIPNEEVAESCAEHPDVLIPFGSVDPWKGRAGAREARRLVEEYGVRGFKFHPSIQGFAPERPDRPTRSTRRSRSSASPRCSTPARPASAPASPAAAASG